MASGKLNVDIEGYGGLVFSEQSAKVLRGEEEVMLRKDLIYKSKKSSTPKKHKTTISLSDEGRELFELLRAKRLELAKEQNVPPYVIFHDKTLVEMSEKKPRKLEEMADISGVGASKLKKYGQIFLDVLQ